MPLRVDYYRSISLSSDSNEVTSFISEEVQTDDFTRPEITSNFQLSWMLWFSWFFTRIDSSFTCRTIQNKESQPYWRIWLKKNRFCFQVIARQMHDVYDGQIVSYGNINPFSVSARLWFENVWEEIDKLRSSATLA